MNPPIPLLLFDAAPDRARSLQDRLAQLGLQPTVLEMTALAAGQPALPRSPLAIIVASAESDGPAAQQASDLVEKLTADNVATVIWGGAESMRWAGGSLVEWLASDTSPDEVVGQIRALVQYGPLIRQLERELAHMHRLGEQLNRYFSEIDQEMRLAGRLQRDFLPRAFPELPGVGFAALYRPASWVSGDMYDVFRVDEHRVGLFLADAMGHGVAAGLLTMFLRQALMPKEIHGAGYRVVSPAQALERLHECLVRQKLPNCQFVTAIYALFDARTRELWIARGGHPQPLLVRADGALQPIESSGSLLGLPDVPVEFDETRLQLAPGEKVVFFTDGLEEDLFEENRAAPGQRPSSLLKIWAQLSATEFVEALQQHLDTKQGSLHPADDVTLLLMEAQAGAGA